MHGGCNQRNHKRCIISTNAPVLTEQGRRRPAQVARGVIGLVVTFHYPLNHHPARLAAEHLEGFWFGWSSISRAFSIAQTCVFVALSLAVAMVVRGLLAPAWDAL